MSMFLKCIIVRLSGVISVENRLKSATSSSEQPQDIIINVVLKNSFIDWLLALDLLSET